MTRSVLAPGTACGPAVACCLAAATIILSSAVPATCGTTDGPSLARPTTLWPAAAPAAAAPTKFSVTDKAVREAIDKATIFLLESQRADGLWTDKATGLGDSELVISALLAAGVSQNHDANLSKALDVMLARKLDRTPEVSYRCLAAARALKARPFSQPDPFSKILQEDVAWLLRTQAASGGWGMGDPAGKGGLPAAQADADFSCTDLAVRALIEAGRSGVEVPPAPLERALKWYFARQRADGSWHPGSDSEPLSPDAAATASAIASIDALIDWLQPARGCPCKDGASAKSSREVDKRMAYALAWLARDAATSRAAKAPPSDPQRLYRLYALQRAAVSEGARQFGDCDWWRGGSQALLATQAADGSWGSIPETCYGILFLQRGMVPVTFNKLRFDGDWNPHPRDITNLAYYITRRACADTVFLWQIVDLTEHLDVLHEAPVLYISAESEPPFSPEDKTKLRAFTDTGGTVLLEASCGSPKVRKWFEAFARQVWPEWPLKPIPAEHPVFNEHSKLRQRSEILGIDDGIRTFLFYTPDDISCAWQTKDYPRKEHMFQWGENVLSYATEHRPLRGKFEKPVEQVPDRYTTPAKAARPDLALARVRYGDGSAWLTGRNYKVMDRLAEAVEKKAGVRLKIDDGGTAPADLVGADGARPADPDIAYLIGAGAATPTDAERQALKVAAARGTFFWIEAAAGSQEWDAAFRKMAAEMKWDLKDFTPEDPVMTGKFPAAAGHDLMKAVRFRYSLRIYRLGKGAHVDLVGIYQEGRLVGIYSPFDVVFSLTDYAAGGCRGYLPPDAAAVATNIILLAGDRPQE